MLPRTRLLGWCADQIIMFAVRLGLARASDVRKRWRLSLAAVCGVPCVREGPCIASAGESVKRGQLVWTRRSLRYCIYIDWLMQQKKVSETLPGNQALASISTSYYRLSMSGTWAQVCVQRKYQQLPSIYSH